MCIKQKAHGRTRPKYWTWIWTRGQVGLGLALWSNVNSQLWKTQIVLISEWVLEECVLQYSFQIQYEQDGKQHIKPSEKICE